MSRHRRMVSFCAIVTSLALANAASPKVRTLTDADFDQATSQGAWLIEFFAPWCSHCRDLESTWDALADELEGKVNVAKVDGTTEKALLGRFNIQGFPSIYHVQGTETRQFASERTLKKLKHFALTGWEAEPALAFWQSPTSALGRSLGHIRGLPARAQRFYRHLHKEKHYSQMTLLAGLLAIPLTAGLAMICILDAYMTRRPASPHPHHQ